MVEVIRLESPGRKPFGILSGLPQIKILASPKTTVALAATLAAITPIGRAAVFAVGKATTGFAARNPLLVGLGAPTVAGALIASPSLRKTALEAADPRKAVERGKRFGEFVEKPDSKIGDALLKGAKTAGLLGAGAAAAALIVPAIIKKVKKKKEQVVEIIPTIPEALPILPATVPDPIGAAEKPPTEEKVVEPLKPMQIKNVFKPSVDISFKKSKRFINQQINVK